VQNGNWRTGPDACLGGYAIDIEQGARKKVMQ